MSSIAKKISELPTSAVNDTDEYGFADATNASQKRGWDEIVAALESLFLLLDVSNGPLTGNLHIAKDLPRLRLRSNNGSNYYELWANVNDTVDGGLNLDDSNGNAIFLLRTADSLFNPDKVDKDFEVYSTATSVSFFVQGSTGRVGVGTETPLYGKLHITQGSDASDEGLAVLNAGSQRSVRVWVDGSNNSRVDSGASGSAPLILNAGGGNVGIGTTAPDDELHVKTTDAIATIRLESSGSNWRILSNSTNSKLTFRDQENSKTPFLIGEAAPDNSLEIASGGVLIGNLLNLTQTSSAAAPTTTEYPSDGDVGVHHNTSSGNRYFCWNDGGTIYKVQMT